MAAAYTDDVGLLVVAPELSTVAVARRDFVRELTETLISISVYGLQTSYAHALMTAHYLDLMVRADAAGGGVAGPVASIADGPATTSYASVFGKGDDSDLTRTGYGQLLQCVNQALRPHTQVMLVNTDPSFRP